MKKNLRIASRVLNSDFIAHAMKRNDYIEFNINVLIDETFDRLVKTCCIRGYEYFDSDDIEVNLLEYFYGEMYEDKEKLPRVGLKSRTWIGVDIDEEEIIEALKPLVLSNINSYCTYTESARRVLDVSCI